MIERTYVIKADEETGYSMSTDSCSIRLDNVTFIRPAKVFCVDHDVHESRFTNEELWNKEEVEKFIRDAKKEGHEEAWAVARKIGGSTLTGNYAPKTLGEIFGTASIMSILENDYETVKKKISDYENMPKVGDIVLVRDEGRAIITDVTTDLLEEGEISCNCLFVDGASAYYSTDDLKKTGEHVDLSDIFKKLKGEE